MAKNKLTKDEETEEVKDKSSDSLASILKEHNFEVLSHEKTLNDFRAVIEILILYIYKVT